MGVFEGISFYIAEKLVKDASQVCIKIFNYCENHVVYQCPAKEFAGQRRWAERVLPQ